MTNMGNINKNQSKYFTDVIPGKLYNVQQNCMTPVIYLWECQHATHSIPTLYDCATINY